MSVKFYFVIQQIAKNFRDAITDSVHLSTGYAALAEHIIAMLAGTVEGDKAAERPDAGSSKRIRILSMSARRGSGLGYGLGCGHSPLRGRGAEDVCPAKHGKVIYLLCVFFCIKKVFCIIKYSLPRLLFFSINT
jgi:hypothetical protein